MCLKYKVC